MLWLQCLGFNLICSAKIYSFCWIFAVTGRVSFYFLFTFTGMEIVLEKIRSFQC